MSIRTTITCDECNDEEEVEIGWNGAELPDGWIEDPEDNEKHLCEYCQVEKGLLPAPAFVEHVMLTHYWRTSPAGFLFHCQYCRAEIWQKDYFYTLPKTCSVCAHIDRRLNGPKLLTGGQE